MDLRDPFLHLLSLIGAPQLPQGLRFAAQRLSQLRAILAVLHRHQFRHAMPAGLSLIRLVPAIVQIA